MPRFDLFSAETWEAIDTLPDSDKQTLLTLDGVSIESTLRNDYSYVKKILKWGDDEIGLEYLPGDKRFGKKLRFGYGHIRRHIGEDGEALDAYVSQDFINDPDGLRDRPIFRIKQLADDGDFDEYKYIIGVENTDQAESAYLSAMPSKFMGGVEQVTRGSLRDYHRENVTPKTDSVTLSNLLPSPDQIRQDFALGLLDRETALKRLGYGSESKAIALKYAQELSIDSSPDARTDEGEITPIESQSDLSSIKEILESSYTKGFTNKISKLVAGVNTEGEIVGIFEDRTTPTAIKRIRFQLTQEGGISYSLLNPRDLDKVQQDAFERYDAKNCKKGIPCKGTCIAANKQCLGATTATQQATVAAVVAAVATPATTTRGRKAATPATTPPTTPATPPVAAGFVRTQGSPIKTNDKGLDTARKDLEQRFGSKLVDDAESNVKRILDDPDTNVHIRVGSSSTLELILGSKFKTSAELGIDTHTIPNLKGGYQDARNRVENKVLGYDPKTTQAGDRPIYGYMAGKNINGTSHADSALAYGSITVRLKSDAKDRATFTGADSFKSGIASDVVNTGNPPPPNAASLVSSTRHGYDKDKLPAHYPSFYADKSGDKGQLQAAASAKNIDDLADGLAPTGNRYIEAQIHGGVKPQDIGEIHFQPIGVGDKPTAAIAQFAKANKVGLFVNGKQLSTQDLDDIINPPTAKDTRSKRFADLQDALNKEDFDAVAPLAVQIHQAAQKAKLAPGETDNFLKQLYKDSGYDSLPEVKTVTDMDKLAKSGKVMMSRGLTGSSASTFADQFRTGDYFTGNGIYGNGTYVGHSGDISKDGLSFIATSNRTSQKRAWKDVEKHNYITPSGATLRMALADNAVVVTADKMRKDMNDVEKKIDAWEQASLTKAANSAPPPSPAQVKKDTTAYKRSLNLANANLISSTQVQHQGAPVTFHQYDLVHSKSGFGGTFRVVILDHTMTGRGYEFKTPDGQTFTSKARSLDKALVAVKDAYAAHYAQNKNKGNTAAAQQAVKVQASAMRDLLGLPPNGDAGQGTSGRFAVMRGIDAIALNNSYEPKSFMNLLNRGKVIVQDTNLTYFDGVKRGLAP